MQRVVPLRFLLLRFGSFLLRRDTEAEMERVNRLIKTYTCRSMNMPRTLRLRRADFESSSRLCCDCASTLRDVSVFEAVRCRGWLSANAKKHIHVNFLISMSILKCSIEKLRSPVLVQQQFRTPWHRQTQPSQETSSRQPSLPSCQLQLLECLHQHFVF